MVVLKSSFVFLFCFLTTGKYDTKTCIKVSERLDQVQRTTMPESSLQQWLKDAALHWPIGFKGNLTRRSRFLEFFFFFNQMSTLLICWGSICQCRRACCALLQHDCYEGAFYSKILLKIIIGVLKPLLCF